MPIRWTRIARAGVAALLLTALPAGCGDDAAGEPGSEDGGDGDGDGDGDGEDGGDGAPPEPPAFGSLEWSACGPESAECAVLELPLDHDNAAAGSFDMLLVRLPHTGDGPAERTIVLNIGGEGLTPPLEQAAPGTLTYVLSDEVRSRADVVYWQPRGSLGSLAFESGGSIKTDADQSPDDAAEAEGLAASLEALATAAAASDHDLLGYLSPLDAAQDLEWVRIALGAETLDMLAMSRGGLYATLWASQNPERVGRIVLDAPFAPHVSTVDWAGGQGGAIWAWVDAALDACAADPDCPFHGGGDPHAALLALHEELDANPRPVPDGLVGQQHLETALITAVLGASSPANHQTTLTSALSQLEGGDVEPIWTLAGRWGDDPSRSSLYAMICEHGQLGTPEAWASMRSGLRSDGVLFADWIANAELLCRQWPVEGSRAVAVPDFDPGLPAMLILGSPTDPQIPYSWIEELHAYLPQSRLVEVTGGSHTFAYDHASECIKEVVDGFLLDGIPPVGDLQCPAID